MGIFQRLRPNPRELGVILVIIGATILLAAYSANPYALNMPGTPEARALASNMVRIAFLVSPSIIGVGVSLLRTRKFYSLWHLGAAILAPVLFWGFLYCFVFVLMGQS